MESEPTPQVDSEEQRRSIVLFLHGSADTGPDFKETLSSFASIESIVPPNAITLFPTAPSQPYTAASGLRSNVWFDRKEIHYDVTEDPVTMSESITMLEGILSRATEEAGGDPRIFLVGFSMGGSMALHFAFHRLRCGLITHGVLVLSSFVGRFSEVIPDLSRAGTEADPRTRSLILAVKMLHGSADTKVLTSWGSATASRLRQRGFDVEFAEVEDQSHEVSQRTVEEISTFTKSAAHMGAGQNVTG